jgi:hypothetical protein
VTTHRRIRIDVDLPELTPAQADFLWNFLEDLATELWDAYESELLEVENQRSRPLEPEYDSTVADCDDLLQDDAPPVSNETDTDF